MIKKSFLRSPAGGRGPASAALQDYCRCRCRRLRAPADKLPPGEFLVYNTGRPAGGLRSLQCDGSLCLLWLAQPRRGSRQQTVSSSNGSESTLTCPAPKLQSCFVLRGSQSQRFYSASSAGVLPCHRTSTTCGSAATKQSTTGLTMARQAAKQELT